MRYVDANVLVSYIANDDAEMFEAAQALFLRVDRGEERIALLDVTVAEVVYVLSSRRLYNLPPREFANRLAAMLSHRGIQMTQKRRCLDALELYATHKTLNFGDAILAATVLSEPETELYSFDKGFDRVPGVVRLEPAAAR